MKLKLDEPVIPRHIHQKILNLQMLLEQADCLKDDILTWYVDELKSYHEDADIEQESFAPGTGVRIEGISELSIMEALSELQAFNEVQVQKRK